MLRLSDVEMLISIADALNEADRVGKSEDEPEGSRYIQISDKAAKQMAQNLIDISARYTGGRT